MSVENKRDLSVSMDRANIVVLFIGIPVAVLQFVFFNMLHNNEKMELTWNYFLFLALVFAGIILHEIIHGITWIIFGKKSFETIKFGFQWKTLTPYAHLKEPIEVNAYRTGAFMPGLIVGIIPFILSLIIGDGNLLWFSMIHTIAAGGDWLILWIIRNIKKGAMVEDHPSQAGCYVIEG